MSPKKINNIHFAIAGVGLQKFELGGTVESNVLEIDEPGFRFMGSIGDEHIIDLGNCELLNGLTSMDVFLALSCRYDIDNIKQNNWRKLRGLPMKRRKNHGK